MPAQGTHKGCPYDILHSVFKEVILHPKNRNLHYKVGMRNGDDLFLSRKRGALGIPAKQDLTHTL